MEAMMAKSQDKGGREARKPKAEGKAKTKVPTYMSGGAGTKMPPPAPPAKGGPKK
jgi:hypothetical protein